MTVQYIRIMELQYESTETYPPSNGKLSICAFSSPVKNCVGFTVLYEVTKLSKGNFGGTRDMCIRLQEGTWKTVGSFAYDKMEKSTTAFSWIDPVDISAYCCPRQVTNGSWFSEKIYLTDIWVADYQYVELESNTSEGALNLAPISTPAQDTTPEVSDYQVLSMKCTAYDASVELPLEIEMLDQTVIRYVHGSHPNSSSGGMYLCRKPGESGIRVVKPRSPVTVLAVRGSLENSTGYAFVETTDAEYGWIRIENNGLVPDPF